MFHQCFLYETVKSYVAFSKSCSLNQHPTLNFAKLFNLAFNQADESIFLQPRVEWDWQPCISFPLTDNVFSCESDQQQETWALWTANECLIFTTDQTVTICLMSPNAASVVSDLHRRVGLTHPRALLLTGLSPLSIIQTKCAWLWLFSFAMAIPVTSSACAWETPPGVSSFPSQENDSNRNKELSVDPNEQ